MLKLIIGVVLALLIGAACRYFDVPVPAPPKLFGALLVVALTVGYVGADWLLPESEAARHTEISGGPS